jgi:hypothetical protein
MKIARRKSQRMKESVAAFAKPLAYKIMRRVAVVTLTNIVVR